MSRASMRVMMLSSQLRYKRSYTQRDGRIVLEIEEQGISEELHSDEQEVLIGDSHSQLPLQLAPSATSYC